MEYKKKENRLQADTRCTASCAAEALAVGELSNEP
jgi:hypothetical protein